MTITEQSKKILEEKGFEVKETKDKNAITEYAVYSITHKDLPDFLMVANYCIDDTDCKHCLSQLKYGEQV